jgi:hypothetical protein
MTNIPKEQKIFKEKMARVVKEATWFGFMNGFAIGICITILFQGALHYLKLF